MKEKAKKGWARILASLLVATVVAGFTPQMAAPVYATAGDPAMNLGAAVLEQNVNTSNAQVAWYANTAWFVIGYDGKEGGAASKSGAVTLLANGNIDQTSFEGDMQNNHYSNSALKSKIYNLEYNLSEGEKEAVVKKELSSGTYAAENTDCVAGDTVRNAHMWPLSTKEANAVNSELRKADPNNPDQYSNLWWLRSPGEGENLSALVDGIGDVHSIGERVDITCGVRPAFDLNLASVLFTSAAEGGKTSGAVGADALKAQSDQTNSGNEWKVTLNDGHENFEITECIPTDNGVSIKYEGAAAGTVEKPEYISAIITDKPITDSTAKITYYGRIQECASESGAVTINTEGKLGENDVLYVFNEQYNGDKKTDYASALKKVTIPKPVSYDVIFKVLNGSWNEGEGDAAKADQTVTLTGYEGDELKLTADQIPAVGSKPDETYKAGSWDTTPDTETAITEDTTYTYTYAQKGTISATVTFKVENGSWNDGEGDAAKADQTVTLTGYEGDELKLTADQIPTVGNKPDETYKAGSWDTTPDTETAITDDTTYTYTYEKDSTPVYYTVTFVDGLGKTLKTEQVEEGKAATAPADPTRSGYTFTGWDKDFSKVMEDMTVTAKWKKKVDPDDDKDKYRNIEGNKQVWYKGSKKTAVFVFKRTEKDSETFSHFIGIMVDGNDVDESYYTAESGSVIIKLKPKYLEKLKLGEHKLTAVFDDGSASVTFSIADNGNVNPDDKKSDGNGGSGKSGRRGANTGDSTDIIMWIAMMLGATLTLTGTAVYRRKRRS